MHGPRLALAALATLAAATAVAADPPDSHTISNVTVIDVEAGRALPAQTVRIDGGVISSVRGTTPDDGRGKASPIDGTGLYLIPGLFDAHVHYVSPDTYDPLCIAHGVTFVREMGNDTSTVIALRDRLNRPDAVGPEMVCTGNIVDGKPPVWPFSEACDTPEEARAAVRKLKDAGVDMIKVYSLLKPDVYRAAVEKAHDLGLKAVGHVPNSVDLDIAMDAGQDCNEHMMGFETLIARLVPQELSDAERRAGVWAGMFAWNRLPRADPAALDAELRKLADKKMMQCPTLVVMAGIGSIAGGNPDADERVSLVPTEIRSFWNEERYRGGFSRLAQQNMPHLKAMVGLLHKAGVPMMIGTDLANPYVFAGASVHDEMKLFAEAGVPAADILRAATIVPAKFCGVDSRLGSVAAGKSASLVLLSANPLEDIGNSTKIAGVFLRGRFFDRAALDAMIDSVREIVAATRPVETKVDMDLPGEVVARGTYVLKFGPYDAGTEDFIITRVDDGYRLKAHSQPKGGPQKPFVLTAEYGAEGVFRRAVYRELTATPLEASYALEGGEIRAAAKRGDKPEPEQKLARSPDALIALPVQSGEYLTFLAAPLKPGETKGYQAYSFGFPSWQVQGSPTTLKREEDTTLKRSSGEEVKARFYTGTTKTPMGPFRAKTWTDERGVVLKSEVTMPFGVITAELK